MNDKLDTRTKILTAAEYLMLREGFHGVTVDRIIAEAGISKGSFFYHFSSKDDLPGALLEGFLARQAECVTQVLAQAERRDLAPLTKVLRAIDDIEEVFRSGACGQPGCVMAAFSYQLMDEYPKLRALSSSALEGWRNTLGKLFEPLCDTADANAPDELAMHFMALLQGANVIARVENDREAGQGAIKHFKLYLTLLHSQAQSGC